MSNLPAIQLPATTSTGRVDYLKLLFTVDYDEGQRIGGQWTAMMENHREHIMSGNFKLRVLEPTKNSNGRNRLILVAWGQAADVMVRIIPLAWFPRIVRIDFREELLDRSEQAVLALGLKKMLEKKGRRNVALIKSKPREKTDERDIGGYGFSVGSRKSDFQVVVYKRGNERPAVEVRLQNKSAKQFANEYHHMASLMPEKDDYNSIMAELDYIASKQVHNATGAKFLFELNDQIDQAEKEMSAMMQAREWMAEPEEEEYFQSLTTEEQQDLQADGFVPVEMMNPKLRG